MVQTKHGHGADEVAVLRLEGAFDDAAAWRVHQTLEQVARGTRVLLDFREVRTFHDFAIELLARDILAGAGRIGATGLSQHQRRILKYFGVADAGLGEPGAKVPRSGAADHPGL